MSEGILGNATGGFGFPKTYIITDNDGNEFIGTVTESVEVFDATPMDVRVDKIFASDNGIQVGMKTIPSYHTSYGYKVVLSGSQIGFFTPECEYDTLMVIITPYNTSIEQSVSSSYVVIDGGVYAVGSASKISDIAIDKDNQKVNLGITASEKSVVRYLITKEEF